MRAGRTSRWLFRCLRLYHPLSQLASCVQKSHLHAWAPNIKHQPHPAVHTRDAARDGGRGGKIFLRGAKRVKKNQARFRRGTWEKGSRLRTKKDFHPTCFRLLIKRSSSLPPPSLLEPRPSFFFSSRRSSSCLLEHQKSLFFRSLLSSLLLLLALLSPRPPSLSLKY